MGSRANLCQGFAGPDEEEKLSAGAASGVGENKFSS